MTRIYVRPPISSSVSLSGRSNFWASACLFSFWRASFGLSIFVGRTFPFKGLLLFQTRQNMLPTDNLILGVFNFCFHAMIFIYEHHFIFAPWRQAVAFSQTQCVSRGSFLEFPVFVAVDKIHQTLGSLLGVRMLATPKCLGVHFSISFAIYVCQVFDVAATIHKNSCSGCTAALDIRYSG